MVLMEMFRGVGLEGERERDKFPTVSVGSSFFEQEGYDKLFY